jgi:hypothetical protein
METGFIYKLTSPSGNSYIGQVKEFSKDGRKRGIRCRWREHCRAAKYGKHKTYLINAINKYNPENFFVEELIQCNVNELDTYEKHFILSYNTLVPNGYNLQTGGTYTKHSDVTCAKRSASLKKLLEDPQKRLIWSKAKKGVINPVKRKCKKKHNEGLPKYIYYRQSHGGKYKGYVVEHPNGSKRFGKQKCTLEENLNLAKLFVQTLSSI